MKKYLLLLALIFVPTVSLASIDTNLRYGSKGAEVTELQEFLIDHNFLTGTATGNFFSLTLKAVKGFQTAHSLPSTGYVGSLTREAINNDLGNNLNASKQAELQETGTVSAPANNTDAFKQAQEANRLLGLQMQAQLDSQAKLDAINASIQKLIVPTPTPTPTPIVPVVISTLDHITASPTVTYQSSSPGGLIRIRSNDTLENVYLTNIKYSVKTPGITTHDIVVIIQAYGVNVVWSGQDGVIPRGLDSARADVRDYGILLRSLTGKTGEVTISLDSADAVDENGKSVHILDFPLSITGVIQ